MPVYVPEACLHKNERLSDCASETPEAVRVMLVLGIANETLGLIEASEGAVLRLPEVALPNAVCARSPFLAFIFIE